MRFAAGLFENVARLFELLAGTGDENDPGAGSRQLLGDDKANAARRAGDDRDLAGYALHRAARQLGVEIEIQLPELPELAAIVTDVGALDTGALQRLAGFLVIEHGRSEEHTSELQSLMRISYAVFCLKKKTHKTT